ncbi:hypothetical protein A2851_01875 [Candidatus Kaiserbacteria bacterium RIFCSPHIGHO2_01_FULL_53_29]|uniref:DUF1653 domain-containing protein n=1 Tax=Candidatus Kaiserbacteria bacterium RIFCSPHIGHO2_01_FULL_53_29 TaxID=1798480 RepID=A0A1F6CWQ1_9BACT|nr:MAG: hypothetical protein A2851_01875 [Candidatus Kaiserbacteria bacterium RIFCSPHIGHO2_01_FULL_53_29]
MIETLRENPKEVFKKGDLVKFKEGIDLTAFGSEFQAATAYRVLHFEHHDDEGGDAVWIGPNDMSPQDVEDFQPELAVELRQEKYKRVFPVATAHLRKVLN